jgi:hypothetical protein
VIQFSRLLKFSSKLPFPPRRGGDLPPPASLQHLSASNEIDWSVAMDFNGFEWMRRMCSWDFPWATDFDALGGVGDVIGYVQRQRLHFTDHV